MIRVVLFALAVLWAGSAAAQSQRCEARSGLDCLEAALAVLKERDEEIDALLVRVGELETALQALDGKTGGIDTRVTTIEENDTKFFAAGDAKGTNQCVRIGTLQVCFGQVDTRFGENMVGNNGATRLVNIAFAQPFASEPTLTASWGPIGGESTGDFLGMYNRVRVDANGAELHLHDRRDQNYGPLLRLDYIAVGTAVSK